MPAVLDEYQVWEDAAGKPLVKGKVYIGDQGADPKVSPQTIYSDREFQTSIENPQPIDALGRTANKIWVRGRYSILVEDQFGTQILQELDNGEPESVGLVTVTNIQGSTDISGSGTPTVTAYVDKEAYIFKTVSINGTPVTLNLDEVGARPVTFANGTDLPAGQWRESQIVTVVYNETSDSFIWEEFDPMSIPEAEAGTSDIVRAVSPAAVAAAIAALETQVPQAPRGNIEAEAITEEYINPSGAKYIPGVVKCWVVAGDSGNIFDSYNVSSVTDNGTGDITVNITTAFSSVEYCPFGLSLNGLPNRQLRIPAVLLVGSFQVLNENDAGTAIDPDRWYLGALGEQV